MFLELFANKKKLIVIIAASCLIGILIFFTNSKPTSSEKDRELIPTVFVHGFKGGPGTFNTMMNRLEEYAPGTKRMIAYVSVDGHVTLRGSLPTAQEPFIQVLFENDRATIEQQTKWLQAIMQRLKSHHDIQQVNLVGHSMGGLAAVSFLLQEENQENRYPSVAKLAVIASPFKGIKREGYFEVHTGPAAEDLKPHSEALESLVRQKKRFPEEIETLLIAGVINESEQEKRHWDGLVHVSSVRGLKDIVSFGNYKEKLVYGKSATHSGLHEHPEVDRILSNFLWNYPAEIKE